MARAMKNTRVRLDPETFHAVGGIFRGRTGASCGRNGHSDAEPKQVSGLADCRSVPAGASSRATDAQLPPVGDRLAWRTVTAPVVKPGPTPGNLRIRAYSPTVSRPIEPGYDTPRRRRRHASRSMRVVRPLRRGDPIGRSRERDAECADSLTASGEGGNGQPRCRASGACGCPGRAAVGDDRT